jgi:hypothetical protein
MRPRPRKEKGDEAQIIHANFVISSAMVDDPQRDSQKCDHHRKAYKFGEGVDALTL